MTLYQVHASHRLVCVRAWIFEIALVHMSAYVHMPAYPSPREAITSGVIWCDIDHA